MKLVSKVGGLNLRTIYDRQNILLVSDYWQLVVSGNSLRCLFVCRLLCLISTKVVSSLQDDFYNEKQGVAISDLACHKIECIMSLHLEFILLLIQFRMEQVHLLLTHSEGILAVHFALLGQPKRRLSFLHMVWLPRGPNINGLDINAVLEWTWP